jgi:protein TonB
MFQQTFVNTQAQTRRPWTVAVSAILQTGLVAAALIVPLLRLPTLDLPAKIHLSFPVEKVDLRAKPAAQQTAPQQPAARNVFTAPTIHIPTSVPRTIDMTPDPPGVVSAAISGTSGNALDGLVPTLMITPAAPPTTTVKPPVPTPTPASPVHVGGAVQEGKLIFGPRPAYPRIAVMARIQGTVRIQAIIERDGIIGHLQVLSGPPMLTKAALDAVQQWRYKPTLLNGQPVEVITEIDVHFALSSQ